MAKYHRWCAVAVLTLAAPAAQLHTIGMVVVVVVAELTRRSCADEKLGVADLKPNLAPIKHDG